jgi:hypothetical protein
MHMLGEIFMTLQLLNRDEIEQAILRIEKIDLTQTSIENIKEILKTLFTGYIQTTPIIQPGLDLFRGIIYNNKPTNLSFLSYPPIEFARENRASRQGQQFFYSATSRQVPLFELGLKEGDKFVLARWQTKKELFLNNIGYTQENFTNLNSNRESPQWNNNEIKPIKNNELNKYIQNYLAKTFSQKIPKDKTYLYKLTIAIAEKLYSEDEEINVKFDGILYPTVPMNGNADNLVLRRSFVDEENLMFMEAEWVEVKKVYDFKFDVDVLDWANSISNIGEIEWKGRLQLWDFFPDEGFYFTDINGRKVGKNKYDEPIEPY